jgi:uncharacterized protein YjdB
MPSLSPERAVQPPHPSAGRRSRQRLSGVLAGVVTLLAACGGTDAPTTPDTTVATVTISPTTATLNAIGATTTLTAQPRNAAGDALAASGVTWTVTDPAVATVSSAGLVTAVANGSTTVRATAGSASASATVTVAQAASLVAVSPETDTIVAGSSTTLTAVVTDAQSAPVVGATVTWSSSDAAVASVASTGEVTGVSPGSATVTATSGSASAAATILVTAAPLIITSDTTLAGTVEVGELSIADGVTVTAGNDLTVRSTGAVTIAGTLEADCHQLRLIADQDIVVTGAVENGCSAPVDSAPSITIVAGGGYDLRTATIVSGGDIDITNDSTLTDDDIPAIGAPVRAARIANQSASICGVNSLAAPPARNGSDGTTGGRGANARTWTLRCRGDLSIGGTVAGQDGGNGGNGTDMTGSANATGGRGGDGGKLIVRATGIIALGAGSTLQSGSGGHGGSATATAQDGSNGTRAFSAVATGGRGGEPGLITVRAGDGVQVSAGARFRLGDGGDGGAATATGAPGRNASETMAAQAGGNATATGGDGGSLDPDRLRAFGNVLGAPAVTGGAGGVGGAATATAGKGGDGTTPMNRNGAEGGRITANGGAGGDALARDLAGVRIASGGAGGAASYIGGMGGLGWNGCLVTPPVLGGNGGAGGSAFGRDGAGGDGLARGVNGGVTFNNVGNGGKAGDGAGPGTPGAAGTNGVAPQGTPTSAGRTFTVGDPGVDCTPPPPPQLPPQVEVRISFLFSPGLVTVGQYVWELLENGEVVGQLPVATSSTPSAHFWGLSGDVARIGWGNGAGWRLFLANAVVNEVAYQATYLYMCILNTQFGAGLQEGGAEGDMQSTVQVIFQNQMNVEIGRSSFSSNSCRELQIPFGTASLDLIGTGAGAFADANNFWLRRFPGGEVPMD